MGFKCCVVGCNTGYKAAQSQDSKQKCSSVFRGCDDGHETAHSDEKRTSVFHFPFNKREICVAWIRFVNRANWEPTKFSVICSKHFEEKYIHRCGKRSALRWMLNPVPTILSPEQKSRLTSNFLEDYMATLQGILETTSEDPTIKQSEVEAKKDKIEKLDDLSEADAPNKYSLYKADNNEYIVYYEMCYGNFPRVKNSIKISRDLTVKLQHDGSNAPLPRWFSSHNSAHLKKKSILQRFPEYLDNLDECDDGDIDYIEELRKFKYYDNPPKFSERMIQQCLFIRSISPRVYDLLLKMFPFPSVGRLSRENRKGNYEPIVEIQVTQTSEGEQNELTYSQPV